MTPKRKKIKPVMVYRGTRENARRFFGEEVVRVTTIRSKRRKRK